MSGIEIIQATVANLCSAVRASADGRDPRVAEALGSCEEASAVWEKVGDDEPLSAWDKERVKITNVEPVLQAASLLMDALREVNPDGLPPSLQGFAHNAQRLLDNVEAKGFRVREPFSPKP